MVVRTLTLFRSSLRALPTRSPPFLFPLARAARPAATPQASLPLCETQWQGQSGSPLEAARTERVYRVHLQRRSASVRGSDCEKRFS